MAERHQNCDHAPCPRPDRRITRRVGGELFRLFADQAAGLRSPRHRGSTPAIGVAAEEAVRRLVVMTVRTRARALLAGLAAAAAVFSVGTATATAAPKRIIGGRLAAGGHWTMTAERTRLSGVAGLCVKVHTSPARGARPTTASSCVSGDLRADQGLWTFNARTGGTRTRSSVVVGIVDSRARLVRLTFRDGKHKSIRTRRGPAGWRRVLATRVRYFGADVLRTSRGTVETVTAYDRRGRRIGRSSEIH
jgi:hypothetical protein